MEKITTLHLLTPMWGEEFVAAVKAVTSPFGSLRVRGEELAECISQFLTGHTVAGQNEAAASLVGLILGVDTDQNSSVSIHPGVKVVITTPTSGTRIVILHPNLGGDAPVRVEFGKEGSQERALQILEAAQLPPTVPWKAFRGTEEVPRREILTALCDRAVGFMRWVGEQNNSPYSLDDAVEATHRAQLALLRG